MWWVSVVVTGCAGRNEARICPQSRGNCAVLPLDWERWSWQSWMRTIGPSCLAVGLLHDAVVRSFSQLSRVLAFSVTVIAHTVGAAPLRARHPRPSVIDSSAYVEARTVSDDRAHGTSVRANERNAQRKEKLLPQPRSHSFRGERRRQEAKNKRSTRLRAQARPSLGGTWPAPSPSKEGLVPPRERHTSHPTVP